MELSLILRVLLRRWWLIAIPVIVVSAFAVPRLLAGGDAVSGGFGTTFRYSAAQQASNLPDRDGDYQDVWLASEFVVNAFTDWARSSTFRDEIADILDDPNIDLNQLGIAADNARSVGLIQMSYPNADDLALIAAAAIEVLQTRSETYFPHLGGQPAQVTIIDAPVIVPVAPPITNRFGPLLQIAVGLVAGVGLAFLAEYLDPTLRDQRELENNGLRVLASIPRQRGL